jgi:hypothetical protein
MDNGLIFPYPRETAHAESVMLSAGSGEPFGADRGSRGPIG